MRTASLLSLTALLLASVACDAEFAEDGVEPHAVASADMDSSDEIGNPTDPMPESSDEAPGDMPEESVENSGIGSSSTPNDMQQTLGEFVREIYQRPDGISALAEPGEQMRQALGEHVEHVEHVGLWINDSGTELTVELLAEDGVVARYSIETAAIYAWEGAGVDNAVRMSILDPDTGEDTGAVIEAGQIEDSVALTGRVGAKTFAWRTHGNVHPSQLGLDTEEVEEIVQAQTVLLAVQPILAEVVELAADEDYESSLELTRPLGAFRWDVGLADEVDFGSVTRAAKSSDKLEELSGAARIEQRRGLTSKWIEFTTLGFSQEEQLVFVSSTFSDPVTGMSLTSQWFASGNFGGAAVAGAGEFNSDAFARAEALAGLTAEITVVLHPGEREGISECTGALGNAYNKCGDMAMKFKHCEYNYSGSDVPVEWCTQGKLMMCRFAAASVLCSCTGQQAQCDSGIP